MHFNGVMVEKPMVEKIKKETKCMFGNVVTVAFQSALRAEMHQNDVFFFLKNHF